MRQTSSKAAIFCFLLFIVSMPPITRADIGVSPSTIPTIVQSGKTTEKSFQIIRTDDELQNDIILSLSSDQGFIFFENDQVVLPAEQTPVDLQFKINAKELSPGQHEATVYLSPKLANEIEGDGNTIEFRLGLKVNVEVVDKIEEKDLSTGNDKQIFFTIQNLSAQNFYFKNTDAIFNFTIKNISDYPIKNIPYKVKIYKDGKKLNEIEKQYNDQIIAAGSSATISNIQNFKEAGAYKIEIANQYGGDVADFKIHSRFSYILEKAQNMFKAILTKLQLNL